MANKIKAAATKCFGWLSNKKEGKLQKNTEELDPPAASENWNNPRTEDRGETGASVLLKEGQISFEEIWGWLIGLLAALTVLLWIVYKKVITEMLAFF